MDDLNTPQQSKTAAPDVTVTWHTLGSQDVLSRLDTPQASGLSSAEAARRLARYGPNELAEPPRTTFLQKVLRQLNDFVVVLLIIAAVISTILSAVEHEPYIESIAILAIVVLNSVLGVVQESRAEQALAALK